MIPGLMTTEQLQAQYSLNARRRVFYQVPNGKTPLMGLLSLMETEEIDKAQDFGWNEDRMLEHEYRTAAANSAGPFTDTSGSSGAVGTDLTAAGWTSAAGTTIRVKLASLSDIQVRDQLMFRNIPGTSSSEKTFQGLVTAIYTAHSTIDVFLIEAATNVLNTSAANAMTVIMVGSATAEADRSRSGFNAWPITPTNHTQIFRHAFDFSRTALKAGLKFDKTGPYKHKAKKNSLKHMKAMEYAFLFGTKSINNSATTDDGLDSTRRTTGGIMWFLKQWEKGNIAAGGAFDYRPTGSDVSASDWRTADDKRIIDVNGTMTKDELKRVLERPFRYLNDSSSALICLCGTGFLTAFNNFVEREATRMVKLNIKETYGMDVSQWDSPYGTIYFKTHPLLSQTAAYRNSAFFLDVGNMRFRPLTDSDTALLKNRQPRDFDGRKDEWLTEAGLELAYPESMMFIDRLTNIVS